MIAAYQDPDHQHGRTLVSTLITALTTRVPKPLTELITLGGALDKQAADMLAYFERPAPATAPPKRLTAPSSTSETAPSACATSPTTPPAHYSKQANSNPNDTHD